MGVGSLNTNRAPWAVGAGFLTARLPSCGSEERNAASAAACPGGGLTAVGVGFGGPPGRLDRTGDGAGRIRAANRAPRCDFGLGGAGPTPLPHVQPPREALPLVLEQASLLQHLHEARWLALALTLTLPLTTTLIRPLTVPWPAGGVPSQSP